MCFDECPQEKRNFDPTTVECCSTESQRPVASVEEGHGVERVVRVNDERVVLRRESW